MRASLGESMNELALFAGAGGGILGGKLLGWRTVCAVEYDAYAASVLVARQNDGCLEPFPVWDDVRTFDGKPWRGIAQVVSGGFPCQDISAAGKGAGLSGERSGLWTEMARIIGEVAPRYVLVENSPMLVIRGLDRVLGDLADLGFDARWGIVGAHHAGAPHRRDRIWILANARGVGLQCAAPERQLGWNRPSLDGVAQKWWDREPEQTPREIAPGLDGVANGMANRVDRMHAIGNGQVPAVAALAWRLLGGPTA